MLIFYGKSRIFLHSQPRIYSLFLFPLPIFIHSHLYKNKNIINCRKTNKLMMMMMKKNEKKSLISRDYETHINIITPTQNFFRLSHSHILSRPFFSVCLYEYLEQKCKKTLLNEWHKVSSVNTKKYKKKIDKASFLVRT